MASSLSEYFLRRQGAGDLGPGSDERPSADPEPQRAPDAPSPASGDAAPPAELRPDPEPQTEASPPAPRSVEELARIHAIFSGILEEWRELDRSVAELKAQIPPQDFESAMRQLLEGSAPSAGSTQPSEKKDPRGSAALPPPRRPTKESAPPPPATRADPLPPPRRPAKESAPPPPATRTDTLPPPRRPTKESAPPPPATRTDTLPPPQGKTSARAAPAAGGAQPPPAAPGPELPQRAEREPACPAPPAHRKRLPVVRRKTREERPAQTHKPCVVPAPTRRGERPVPQPCPAQPPGAGPRRAPGGKALARQGAPKGREGESVSVPPGDKSRKEVNQQLAEVLSLLRSRLASEASVSPASVSIPRELTAEIASEVAHQVKQEVLSKMESALKQLKKSASRRQKVESTKKLRLSALARGLRRAVTPGNPAGAEAEAPRVPLDDVPGLIDQMLRGKEAPQQEKPFR